MNIDQLKAALKPAFSKITLSNGIELYAHRPTIADLEKCTTPKGTLIHCICDETGYHVFADGDEAGKININTELDSVLANELFEKAMLLWDDESTQDEIEKK